MKVEYITHSGSDLLVVNAARVSFNKEVEEFRNEDERLIKYLARYNHWTPFSHCQITLRETVPIFVARQRFKHTVGFTYNEVSRRYVTDTPEFYTPDSWRKASENVKQGSSDEELITFIVRNNVESWTTEINDYYSNFIEEAKQFYLSLIDQGVAPEQARMVLPQSMYTSYYVTGSLYAFAHAYMLRSDQHAQKEIQYVAKEWNRLISNLYPISWSALTINGGH